MKTMENKYNKLFESKLKLIDNNIKAQEKIQKQRRNKEKSTSSKTKQTTRKKKTTTSNNTIYEIPVVEENKKIIFIQK